MPEDAKSSIRMGPAHAPRSSPLAWSDSPARFSTPLGGQFPGTATGARHNEECDRGRRFAGDGWSPDPSRGEPTGSRQPFGKTADDAPSSATTEVRDRSGGPRAGRSTSCFEGTSGRQPPRGQLPPVPSVFVK
jgi:hypothetical protein